MTDTTRLTAQRLVSDVIAGGDVAVLKEICSPELEYTGPAPARLSGRDGYRQIVEELHEAFDELGVETVQLVAEGDRAVVRLRVSGTQVGEWGTLPPCSRAITFEIVHLIEVHDGVIVRCVDARDQVSIWAQVGAVPSHLQELLAAAPTSRPPGDAPLIR